MEKKFEQSKPEPILEPQGQHKKEEIKLTPEQQTAKEDVIRSLSTARQIHDVVRIIKESFSLPEEIISSPEVQQVAKECMIRHLSNGYIDIAIQIKETFNIPGAVISSPEVQQAAQKGIIKYLVNFRINFAIQIKEAFNVPEAEAQQVAKEIIIKYLSNGDIPEAIKIKKAFNISGEVISSPEVQQAAQKGIIKSLSNHYIPLADALKIKEAFNVPEAEAQQVAKEIIIKYLVGGHIDFVIKIKEAFNIPESEVQEAAQKGIIECLSNGDISPAIKIKEAFNISGEVISSPEVQQAAQKGIIQCLVDGRIDFAIKIKEAFNVPEAEAQQVAKERIIECLVHGYIDPAIKIKEAFNVPEAEAQQAAKEAIIRYLSNGSIDHVVKIKEAFNTPQSVINEIDNELLTFQLNKNSLISFIKYLGSESLAEFSKFFDNVRTAIFNELSADQDLADYFVENLEKYYQQSWVAENVAKAIQQYSVAQKFIDAVENDKTVWKNEPWVADVFSEAQAVLEEFDQDDDGQDSHGYRHGHEGFRESDPYENHSWRFGADQILLTNGIVKILTGEITDGRIVVRKTTKEVAGEEPVRIPNVSKKDSADWNYELSVSELSSSKIIEKEEKITISSEILQEFEATRQKIEFAYQDFINQLRSNPNIKDEDKKALLDPESIDVHMTPLLDNVRSFVARYFVQSIEGRVERLSEIINLNDGVDRVLREGFNRYIKIHEVDVPLYDKLYEEFDNLRETGRYPLEVYLGRDGIYAWIGRRTQDVARQRKLGREGRKKLKEIGEVLEIHPKYIVYPRYFRDDINYETKRQFLEQEGISPDADPLFYDTGYTGTIPEQIMRVMDFSDEDIEQRIRLLSAPSIHRRVKGIPENARSEIIEYIEHNAKTEETAEGLIIDEKTGKIRHIAQPTNPEEQFYFMMVKQAIARHYWLQERLHHEPSGSINFDSEHYTIRIRQEYSKLLPQEFLHDPKAFFNQQGELLKSSKGEGEYPDEEVVLFKMTDGTEIVAKKIELRKAKEARKEFSILISAKKAGLPTAEPVGFLTGKEESDGSYLLMKKIEGISGRNFDKYLRETGKFTEEKIKSILQQVAEKNKEMAELFRTTLKIDKRWRIKDTIIEFNEETGEVGNVTPIDWERAQNFNPATPKEIDEIN